jgi:hypothetical protein
MVDRPQTSLKIKIANRSRLPGLIRVILFVFIFPLPPRRAALKEVVVWLILRGDLSGFAPAGAVFDDPVRQSAFKADVVAGLLGLNPLVPENLLTFRLKFAVKRGILQQVACRR